MVLGEARKKVKKVEDLKRELKVGGFSVPAPYPGCGLCEDLKRELKVTSPAPYSALTTLAMEDLKRELKAVGF